MALAVRAGADSRHLEEACDLFSIEVQDQHAGDLPASSEIEGAWQAYFAVLDRALEDRRLSADERDALRDVAASSGLSRSGATQANSVYLESVIQVAFADGVISDSERRDLGEEANLLGLSADLDRLIEVARVERPGGLEPPLQSHDIALGGKTVCFTGALNGLVDGRSPTRKSVTKKLDYLVIADPDSMSDKAKKARSYGARILSEPVFWPAMGVQVE